MLTGTRRLGALRGGLWLAALCAAIAAIVVVALPASGASTSNPKTALIDGQSVTTDDGITNEAKEPISLEQYAAEQAGYKVTVVSNTEWEAMSAEEFAKYQLLIVGDPICNETASSAIENAATWAPVVMGTSGLNPLVGNRAVVGTDPEFHYADGAGGAQPTNPDEPNTAGAEHLVQDGITYAGGVEGATGVYFDTSCSDPDATPEGEPPVAGGDLTVLERLTAAGPGQWSENAEDVPCGGEVRQIAENPVFDAGTTKLTDSNIEGWSCSVHIAFPHFPPDWNALAVAIDTPSLPTCGVDPESKEEVCGQAYVLVAGAGIVAEAPNLTLEPKSGTNHEGESHTVTATVVRAGAPVPNAAIDFLVTGLNSGVTGTCTTSTGAPDPGCETDETGVVRFTYTDTKGTGEDTINASVTLAGSTQHATATETWIAGEGPPVETKTTPVETKTTTTKVETTPTATTATNTTPAPAPAAKGGVLGFGTAHLARSSQACIASSSYLASVSGTDIGSVTFTLNGHKVKTVSKANSQGAFSLRVTVPAGKVEHLAMHVAFSAAASNHSETISKTLARCAAVKKVTTPRFTG
jgi:hypothetical protein